MQSNPATQRVTRRSFATGLIGLGGAVIGGDLLSACSAAQRPSRMPLLGYVGVGPVEAVWEGFRDGMRDLGWTEGQTFQVDRGGLTLNRTELPGLAARLVARPVDLIVAYGTPGAQAAQQATSTLAIVMFGVLSDPVELGLVASLARPGGNITGGTSMGSELSAKRLELLKEVVPGCTRIAVLLTPDNGSRGYLVREAVRGAQQLGLDARFVDVDSSDEIVTALNDLEHWPVDAIVALPDARLASMYPTLIGEVARRRIPTTYGTAISSSVANGALMGFGPDQVQYRRPAYFIDKILRGANPGDLPIEQPSTFEFVVNTATATALGLTFPPNVAAQVTDWI